MSSTIEVVEEKRVKQSHAIGDNEKREMNNYENEVGIVDNIDQLGGYDYDDEVTSNSSTINTYRLHQPYITTNSADSSGFNWCIFE